MGIQGVHYGTFPGKVSPTTGALESVWVVLRPHNWHPQTTDEVLLELHADTGVEGGAGFSESFWSLMH